VITAPQGRFSTAKPDHQFDHQSDHQLTTILYLSGCFALFTLSTQFCVFPQVGGRLLWAIITALSALSNPSQSLVKRGSTVRVC